MQAYAEGFDILKGRASDKLPTDERFDEANAPGLTSHPRHEHADVFVEAYKRAPLLRWRGKPMLAWLYRVASNMAADYVRKAAREVAVADVPERVAPEDETFGERDAVARALRALPSDYQLVVHLRLVEGYPYDDVARAMGRTVGACQMLMLRAGRALREALEAQGIHARA